MLDLGRFAPGLYRVQCSTESGHANQAVVKR